MGGAKGTGDVGSAVWKSNGTELFSHSWTAGAIVAYDGGYNLGATSVLWTSASAGNITVSGFVADGGCLTGRTTDWELLVNGLVTASGSYTGSTSPTYNQSFSLGVTPISANQIVELTLWQPTITQGGNMSTMGLTVTEMPEPPGLLVIGGLLLLACCWRPYRASQRG